MPIEIRELVIRVKVNEKQPPEQPLRTAESRDTERKDVEDAVLREAVEQVLKLLQERKER